MRGEVWSQLAEVEVGAQGEDRGFRVVVVFGGYVEAICGCSVGRVLIRFKAYLADSLEINY